MDINVFKTWKHDKSIMKWYYNTIDLCNNKSTIQVDIKYLINGNDSIIRNELHYYSGWGLEVSTPNALEDVSFNNNILKFEKIITDNELKPIIKIICDKDRDMLFKEIIKLGIKPTDYQNWINTGKEITKRFLIKLIH